MNKFKKVSALTLIALFIAASSTFANDEKDCIHNGAPYSPGAVVDMPTGPKICEDGKWYDL